MGPFSEIRKEGNNRQVYREVFAADDNPPDPGRVFYTIRPQDVGRTVIRTEIGPVHVSEFMGRIIKNDVGKRLYRVPNNAGDMWFWQVENYAQRDERLRKEQAQ